ncbi:MAG: hypothetical protein FH753_15390 [Firmicutes bacterium]|nr:hypothetical protein [Bacillota bacterium]
MNKDMKVIRTYKQILKSSRNEIFPLLCPVREKEWLQGWDYDMIISDSGFAEKGCVFKTNNPYGNYHWVITKHDFKNYEIQFVKTIMEKLIVIIDISLKEMSENNTHCYIKYTFIALNERVIDIMHKESSKEEFNKHMKKWERSLNYYLKHGKMLVE